MLLALATVPEDNVLDTFNDLVDEMPEETEEVVEYFDLIYLNGRPARGRGRAVVSLYPVRLWNQYEAALQGLHKTNNVSEGWHNRFRIVVGKDHPDLYSLLAEFQKEQQATEACIIELNLGKYVRAAPREEWITVQERIRRIALEFERYKEEELLVDYLRTIGHNISIA